MKGEIVKWLTALFNILQVSRVTHCLRHGVNLETYIFRLTYKIYNWFSWVDCVNTHPYLGVVRRMTVSQKKQFGPGSRNSYK